MNNEPTPLGDALRAVTDDLVGGQQRSGSVWDGGLANRWAEIVGPMLHDCTLPGSLRDGVLTIHANDPAAASIVRQRSGDIAAQLRDQLSLVITQIKVVVSRSC